MKYLLTACFLFFTVVPARAGGDLEAAWLRMIQTDFGPSCAVERLKASVIVSGNNGLRTEQWFLQTCRGNFEYSVAYYPPAYFPGRPSPYEVKQISPSTGARFKNPPKSTPFRGSAKFRR